MEVLSFIESLVREQAKEGKVDENIRTPFRTKDYRDTLLTTVIHREKREAETVTTGC